MAFQFQMVGALSPLFATTYGVGLADIGLLIGLFSAPGMVISIPGGSLAARFGDKRLLVGAAALMVLGGVLAATAQSMSMQIVARVIAGVGGITINVVGTKVVADLFGGREIGTAMAIFINSWPFGIALALLILPALAGFGGLGAALGAVAGFTVIGLLLLMVAYRPLPHVGTGLTAAQRPRGSAGAALLLAALIWSLLNVALLVVFSFGPVLLTDRGMDLIPASGMTSLTLWVLAATAPFGGTLADRTGRRDGVILGGLAVYGAGLLTLILAGSAALGFVLVGLGVGLCAGPIMMLPAAVLTPVTRSIGMGLFYSIYYGFLLAGPAAVGALATWQGSARPGFVAALAMIAVCVPLLAFFRSRSARPLPA